MSFSMHELLLLVGCGACFERGGIWRTPLTFLCATLCVMAHFCRHHPQEYSGVSTDEEHRVSVFFITNTLSRTDERHDPHGSILFTFVLQSTFLSSNCIHCDIVVFVFFFCTLDIYCMSVHPGRGNPPLLLSLMVSSIFFLC